MENVFGKNKNLVAIAAAVIIAVGAFLPFAKASFLGMSQSVALISTNIGWVVLLLAGVGLFAGIINSGWLMPVSGILSFAVVLGSYSSMTNSSSGDEFADMFVSSLLQRDAGFYVIIFGAVLLILAAFFRNNHLSGYFQK